MVAWPKFFLEKRVYCQFVAFKSEADNDAFYIWRNIRLVPERFSRKGIGNMYFDCRSANRLYSISDSYRGMRVRSRVENDSIKREACLMKLINNLSFNIALEIMKLKRRKFSLKRCEVFLKGSMSIDFGFAFSEQI